MYLLVEKPESRSNFPMKHFGEKIHCFGVNVKTYKNMTSPWKIRYINHYYVNR